MRSKCVWTLSLGLLIFAGQALTHRAPSNAAGSKELHIAGVQLEFPDPDKVLMELERTVAKVPEAKLLVLSEYTFDGRVPQAIMEWCDIRDKYLIAGGKDYSDADETQFRNTAFVIGPDGSELFEQVKKVPIQFFKDGLPAAEQKVWYSPWGAIGLCVCYDLSYTRVTDELIRQGAQALIVPTADVKDWGARQHRLHARVAPIRAAEYRIPIFRLCSSGISQAVDARGRVIASAPFPGQGEIITAKLQIAPQRKWIPLDRYLVWLCLFVCAGLLVWHVASSALKALLRKRERGQDCPRSQV